MRRSAGRLKTFCEPCIRTRLVSLEIRVSLSRSTTAAWFALPLQSHGAAHKLFPVPHLPLRLAGGTIPFIRRYTAI